MNACVDVSRPQKNPETNAALIQIQDQVQCVCNGMQNWKAVCSEFELLLRLVAELWSQLDHLPGSYIELLDDLNSKLQFGSKKDLKAMSKQIDIAALKIDVQTAIDNHRDLSESASGGSNCIPLETGESISEEGMKKATRKRRVRRIPAIVGG